MNKARMSVEKRQLQQKAAETLYQSYLLIKLDDNNY